MMVKYYESVEINHNLNLRYILDHPYKILIVGGSGSGQTNMLLNLIKSERSDIDKIYFYVKDPFESKYQLLIKKWEKVGIKELKHLKAYVGYNPTRKRKVLIVFDIMIADTEAKKIKSCNYWIVFKRKKIQHFTCFHVAIHIIKCLKLWDKKEIQQTASGLSSDVEFKDYMKLYKEYTDESFSF